MDSYIFIGYIVALIIIIFLLKRIYGTNVKLESEKFSNKNSKTTINIICQTGLKNISKKKLIDILSQFNRNIIKITKIIDPHNCYNIQILIKTPIKKIKNWINTQTDPLFVESREKSVICQEDDIENEKQQLNNKMTNIVDFMYNSKKETTDPVEDCKDANTFSVEKSTPNKTKRLLCKLSQDLNTITNTINNSTCTIIDTLDITSLETLMDKITKYMNEYIPKNQNFHKSVTCKDYNNNKDKYIMRNNSKIMNCYKNECGLGNDYTDSAFILVKKSKEANKYFPFIDAKKSTINLNRFNTIIR